MYYKDENSVFCVLNNTSFVFVQGSVVGLKEDEKLVSEIIVNGEPITQDEFFNLYNDALKFIEVKKMPILKTRRHARYHTHNGKYYQILSENQFQELDYATKKKIWYRGDYLTLDMVKNYKTSTKKQFDFFLKRMSSIEWIYR